MDEKKGKPKSGKSTTSVLTGHVGGGGATLPMLISKKTDCRGEGRPKTTT